MTDDIRRAITDRRLMDDYNARPHYQRNDYLAWIGRAKRPKTRQKRIAQMLDELNHGGIYMGIPHEPSLKN